MFSLFEGFEVFKLSGKFFLYQIALLVFDQFK